MTRILVVGDVRLYSDGIAAHLDRSPGLSIIGVATDGPSAIAMTRDGHPDIVLLDVAIADSMTLVREIRAAAPATRVVALTIPEVERAVVACAEAGVAGYVPRTASLDDLVVAVRSAAVNESIVSPSIANCLLRRIASLAEDRATADTSALTVREVEIIRLIDQGCSNKQIAARLCIELSTVKNHVHNLLDKLGVHRRSEAAARMRRALASTALIGSTELAQRAW
jgi:two-component system nitrate/nitrite response regulator NarL